MKARLQRIWRERQSEIAMVAAFVVLVAVLVVVL